jgi:ATP-dependent DNA helicase PIF1
MTITQIEVSLRDTFEDGQAYVALSRVTSLEGLRIREDFLRERITASASVRKFYRDLQTVNDGSKEANK